MVNEKNPSNIFCKETSLGRNAIFTQNFKTFLEQNPQNSIFHNIFYGRKKNSGDFKDF